MAMLQLWMESIQQPTTLALLIILSTYILEDAAIVSAAFIECRWNDCSRVRISGS